MAISSASIYGSTNVDYQLVLNEINCYQVMWLATNCCYIFSLSSYVLQAAAKVQ